MRKLWNVKEIGWDDLLLNAYKREWIVFFQDLFQMKHISFSKLIKLDAIGSPSIVVFSDGSNDSFGACVYVRWKKSDGTFESQMVASKNRITPLQRITTVRSELCKASQRIY